MTPPLHEPECRVAVVQMRPVLGDVPMNLAEIRRNAIDAQSRGAQLIVFPELATTGYCFRDLPELEQCLAAGTGVDELVALSSELSVVLVVGYAEVLDGVALNKAILIDRGDIRADYVKTHLWDTEKNLFRTGDRLPPVVDTSVGRVGLAICYDLEFPELFRHFATKKAHIVAAPTNWPAGFEAESHVGPFNGELLRAMGSASTNRLFVAIACRTGIERGVDWVENSCVVDPDGYPITEFMEGPGIALVDVNLNRSEDKTVSPNNDALKDRRLDLY